MGLALLTIGMYSAQWAADRTNVGVRREPVHDVVGLPSELQIEDYLLHSDLFQSYFRGLMATRKGASCL